MIGSVYKFLSKVLVRRFSKSLKFIIGDYQHAFIEGRQITDAIMIANEVVDATRTVNSYINLIMLTRNSLTICLIELVMASNGGDG